MSYYISIPKLDSALCTGIREVQVSLAEDLQSFPILNNNTVPASQINTSWELIHERGGYDGELEQQAQQTDSGVLYTKQVQLFVPDKEGSNALPIDKWMNKKLILKVLDYDGITWLVGHYGEYMRLRYQYGTDQLGGARKGYALRFEGTHRIPIIKVL